jgi:cob(I)alamin adenosyltransferase
VARARARAGSTPRWDGIQNELFHLGSDLCLVESDKEKRAVPQIEARHVATLEAEMDRMLAELGRSRTSSSREDRSWGAFHLARTDLPARRTARRRARPAKSRSARTSSPT